MHWLGRLGLLFNVLALWLAAPEVLGERRLRAIKRGVDRGGRIIPEVGVALGVLLVAALALVARVERVWSPVLLILLLMLGMVALTMAMVLVMVPGKRLVVRLLFAFEVVAFWGMMLVTSTMLEMSERTSGLPGWLLALVMWVIALGGALSGVAAGVIVVSWLEDNVAFPLLERLASNERIRRRWRDRGIGVFMFGVFLQLTGTLLS
jgi:hypothetical protein